MYDLVSTLVLVLLVCVLIMSLLITSLLQASLAAYQKATQLLSEKVKVEIPPEIINNIGTLYFKLGDMEKAKERESLNTQRHSRDE